MSNAQPTVEIDGPLVVGYTNAEEPLAGAIRFNTMTNTFEGWNGLFWANLTRYSTGKVQDIDGNEYITARIGKREWMLENLKTTTFNNGSSIYAFNPDAFEWENLAFSAWCYYNDNPNYNDTYGKLYNWKAISGGKLCPTGWLVPDIDDWEDLWIDLGGVEEAGGKMKQTGTQYWIEPNVGATNETGFTGLPGGIRGANSSFQGVRGYWWTSTQHPSGITASAAVISSSEEYISSFQLDKSLGMSVRCIKEIISN